MITTLINWYGKPAVYGFALIVGGLIVAGIFLYAESDEGAPAVETETTVQVARVAELASGRTLEVIGTVEAIDQTQITAEASGRVTNVRVALGDTVSAGAIIAELENASEYAAVLQAEGAYEAALAGAAQGNVSVAEARTSLRAVENSAVTAFRNAFNTFRSILLNDVDTLFTDPSGRLPGLRIDGGGQTSYLNAERVAFQDVLREWRSRADAISVNADLDTELAYAESQLHRLAQVVDVLVDQANDEDSRGVFSAGELNAISATLSNDRATLNGSLGSLDSAQTSLANAREAVTRAELGGTESDLSSANAQVKQALGSLRSAQANYEKTILRTSIAGSVNSLSVKVGDFVGMSEVVARVANNDALEITAYVSGSDRDLIEIGESVLIEGEYDGVVTNIAPAIDPATKKFEVKIGAETDAIANGDSVRVAFTRSSEEVSDRISVPITALKVETDRVVVFTVSDAGRLEAHEVIEGPLVGSNIIIEEGVTPDMQIVVDARGLNEGDTVSLRE